MFDQKKLVGVRKIKYLANDVGYKIQLVTFPCEHGVLTYGGSPIISMVPYEIEMCPNCCKPCDQKIDIFHQANFNISREERVLSTPLKHKEFNRPVCPRKRSNQFTSVDITAVSWQGWVDSNRTFLSVDVASNSKLYN